MKFVLYAYAVPLIRGGSWRHFGDNLARSGDFVTFFAKYGCFRNFKLRVCKTYMKRDTDEYSRIFCKLLNFARCDPL